MKKFRTHRWQNPAVRLVQALFGEDWRMYNATLARALGSVNAAIFYQQCCYWTSKIEKKRKGWFYKTIAEFQEELGMSRYKQETAIKILLKHKLIEKRRGYMAKRYFRITDGIIIFAQKMGLLENNKPNREITSSLSDENKQFIYKDYTKITKDIANKNDKEGIQNPLTKI